MDADDTAGQARKGFLDSVTGKAKEVFGALSGNDSLTSEGQLQQQDGRQRTEANRTKSVAATQAEQAHDELAEARDEGARHRAATEGRAAGETAGVRAEQQVDHRQADHQQRRETAAAQADATQRADAGVRAAAEQDAARQAAATRDTAQALGRHARTEADADADQAQASQARRAAEQLTREEGLE